MLTVLRLFVVISTAVGIGLGTWLGAREWPPLLYWSIGGFVLGVVASRTGSRLAWGLALAPAYILPVLFHVALGYFLIAYHFPWAAAVFGLTCGGPLTRWSLPARWCVPLVYWAAVVAATWPIVVLREADFHLGMLAVYHNATSGLGGPPPVVAVLVILMAVMQLVGILLFDTCFAKFDLSARRRFEAFVVLPLFAGAVINAALSVYQGVVDIEFLNAHFWPFRQRAGGGLVDANASGAVAGFWICAAFVLVGTQTRVRLVVSVALTMLLGVGLWATGSRSALVSAAVVLMLAFWSALRKTDARRKLLVGALLLVVLIGAGTLMTRSASPITRTIQAWREGAGGAAPLEVLTTQIFNRGAPVGTMWVQMMEAHPLAGVGVGGFYLLMSDYSWKITGIRMPADNAQSWYRHQLAELGLVGSVGWIWWTVAIGGLLVRTRGDGKDAVAAACIKAILISMALVAAISGPTHALPIALSVWVWAFWYLTASRGAQDEVSAPSRSMSRLIWPVVTTAVLLFAAGTAWVGWTKLRPPYRASWADWEYWRGASDPAPGPNGNAWWTEQESVIVKTAVHGYARVEFWLIHPDLAQNPVQVKLWRQPHQLILDTSVRSSEPQVFYIRVPDGEKSLMLETWVSRTWNRGAHEGAGPQVVGLAMLDWTFIITPPDGARILQ